MKIPPVSPGMGLGNRPRRTILSYRGGVLKRPDFTEGTRVKYIGFGGQLFLGAIEKIELVNAGWGKFYRVTVRLDHRNRAVDLNWSLFSERLIVLESKDE